MTKSAYTLVFLLVTTICTAHYDNTCDYSFSSLLSQQESSWRLLEELIIKQPKKNVNLIVGKKGAALLTSGGIGILSYTATKSLTGSSSFSKACSLGTGLATILFTYAGIKKYLLKQEEHRQLTKLMNIWPYAKEKMPQEVQHVLEELHSTWKSNPDNYGEHTKRILEFLKEELHTRYAYR